MFSADPFGQQNKPAKHQVFHTTELGVIANAELGVRANAELGFRANAELGVIANVRTLENKLRNVLRKNRKTMKKLR